MAQYRVDYTAEGEDRETVIESLTRQDAMAKARRLSAKHGTAYAIRSDYGRYLEPGRMHDTGQRVYYGGYYSHDDDTF